MHFNWDSLDSLLPDLPPNLTRVPRFFLYCPSRLWKLLPRKMLAFDAEGFYIDCGTVPKFHQFMTTYLPQTLETVNLHQASEWYIKLLPLSITSLQIYSIDGENVFFPNWVNHLTCLQSLHLGSDTETNATDFAQLEVHLTALTLRGTVVNLPINWSLPCFNLLQSLDITCNLAPLTRVKSPTALPRLHTLGLLPSYSPFLLSQCPLLPNSVEHLKIAISRLDTPFSLAITRLPAKIESLILSLVQFPVTANWVITRSHVSNIPKTLTTLRIICGQQAKKLWEAKNGDTIDSALFLIKEHPFLLRFLLSPH
jgi:hypothetical protein